MTYIDRAVYWACAGKAKLVLSMYGSLFIILFVNDASVVPGGACGG